MRHIEWIFGAAVAATGAAVAFEGTRLGYISGGVPGAGFFPFWVGLMLVITGLALACRGWVRPSETERVQSGQIAAVLGGGAFLAIMAIGGAIMASVVYICGAIVLSRRHRLITAVITSVVATGVIYVAFRVWLYIPLPRGLLFGGY